MSTYIKAHDANQINYYEDCPDVLRRFLNYLRAIKNLSVQTVNGYYVDIRTFMRFLIFNRRVSRDTRNIDDFKSIRISDITVSDVQNVTPNLIYEYLSFTVNFLGNSPSTRCRKLSALKTFYKYLTLISHDFEENPSANIEMPKIGKRQPKYLDYDECLKLLSTTPSSSAERDTCMLVLLLNCGMRLSELTGINLKDIRDNDIRIIGKGNKERIVYLNKACQDALSDYLTYRKSLEKVIDKDALFISEKTGKRLSNRRVEQIVEKAFKLAGLGNKGYSVHKLRHTAATQMFQGGNADMLTIKEILGHEHIATTEIYTHLSAKQLVDAAKNTPMGKLDVHEINKKKR